MKKVNTSVVVLWMTIFLATSCTEYRQNRGSIVPKNSSTKLTFTTDRSIILLPVLVDGVPKSFLFDTGADFTTLHTEKVTGRSTSVSGADGAKVKVGLGTLDVMKIGESEFRNTFIWKLPMDYLVKNIPNFGGVLGQSSINKANWLIDYTSNTLEFSDKTIETPGFETIKIKNVKNPIITLTIEGENHQALIDLGASVALTIPKGSALGDKLIEKYKFEDKQRERFVASGVQTIDEKVGVVSKISLGNLAFDGIETNISPSKSIRVGNKFFKDYALYIDNTNGAYKLKKIN